MASTSQVFVPSNLAGERDNALSAKESAVSAVSWAAVAAGAFVAAALSLILLSLGAGLGLSSVSPWSNTGASAGAVSAGAIAWMIVMQIASSVMGGYLAGRLRTKWATVHTDEVYFRDTVHGLIVWSVGLVVTASFLTSATISMVGGASTVAAAKASEPNNYYVDTLFRAGGAASDRYDERTQTEAARIVATAMGSRDMASADRAYLAQMISARTGISPAEADKRVTDVIGDARQAIDSARKATAHGLLWLFIALLIGAFSASYAATIGGRQRDYIKAIQ